MFKCFIFRGLYRMTTTWWSGFDYFLILEGFSNWFFFRWVWFNLELGIDFSIGSFGEAGWLDTFWSLNRSRSSKVKIYLVPKVIFDGLLDSTFMITLFTTARPRWLPSRFDFLLNLLFLRFLLFFRASLLSFFGWRLPSTCRLHNLFDQTSLYFHSFNLIFVPILFFL